MSELTYSEASLCNDLSLKSIMGLLKRLWCLGCHGFKGCRRQFDKILR